MTCRKPFILQDLKSYISPGTPFFVFDWNRSDQRTGLAVSQIIGGTQFSKMNVDLPMNGQPVWLVSGVCSTGSGLIISKEHFCAFENILGIA